VEQHILIDSQAVPTHGFPSAFLVCRSYFSYSTFAMSDFFRNPQDVTVAGGNFNHSTTIITTTGRQSFRLNIPRCGQRFDEVSGPPQAKALETDYLHKYNHVKRGGMIILKNVWGYMYPG